VRSFARFADSMVSTRKPSGSVSPSARSTWVDEGACGESPPPPQAASTSGSETAIAALEILVRLLCRTVREHTTVPPRRQPGKRVAASADGRVQDRPSRLPGLHSRRCSYRSAPSRSRAQGCRAGRALGPPSRHGGDPWSRKVPSTAQRRTSRRRLSLGGSSLRRSLARSGARRHGRTKISGSSGSRRTADRRYDRSRARRTR